MGTMPKQGPIVILDSDVEDHALLREALFQLGVNNKLYFFNNGIEALDYLRATTEQPFIIISEVNLTKMDGLEFRRQVNGDEKLRNKAIPFVFLTDNPDRKKVEEAYEMMVQGYFIKKNSIPELKNTLHMLLLYWTECLHRNSNFWHQ